MSPEENIEGFPWGKIVEAFAWASLVVAFVIGQIAAQTDYELLLIGDLFFTALLFGGFQVLERNISGLIVQPRL